MMEETPLRLDLDALPRWIGCDFRQFEENERHVSRTAAYSVLILMLEGELIFAEDGQRVSLTAGEWYIQRSGLKQDGIEPSRLPFYFYIHFDGSFSSNPAYGLPLRGKFEIGEISPLLDRLLKALHSDSSAVRRGALFYSLLTALEEGQKKDALRIVVARMTDYIAAHFTEGIRLSHLARAFGYSEDHVIRLFKANLNTTPHRYIQSIRLARAQQLMLTTDRTLQTVAAQSGYGDPSSMHRAFVEETGLSPAKWRKAHRL